MYESTQAMPETAAARMSVLVTPSSWAGVRRWWGSTRARPLHGSGREEAVEESG
jgi:hypothetical protein